MSIAEKLVTVAENVEKVYNAGYEKGKAEGGGTAKEEQEKTVNITENGTTEVSPDENKVFSKVTVKVDVPSGGGVVDYMSYLNILKFSEAISEVTDNIVLHLENVTSLSQAFANVSIYSPKITFHITEKCTTLSSLFQMGYWSYSGELKEVEFVGETKGITSWGQAFRNRIGIERIVGDLDFTNVTSLSSTFGRCDSLQVFTPKPNTIKVSISFSDSPNLTDESKQAIFDGLATIIEPQTLTLHNQVKILQSQVDSANAKGWTVAGGTVVSEEEYYG